MAVDKIRLSIDLVGQEKNIESAVTLRKKKRVVTFNGPKKRKKLKDQQRREAFEAGGEEYHKWEGQED